jgi:hypothetical protein
VEVLFSEDEEVRIVGVYGDIRAREEENGATFTMVLAYDRYLLR